MTAPTSPVRRVLAQEVTDLPAGDDVRPTTPADVAALTALVRSVDIEGCGHSSTNLEEVTAELADPDCGWECGSVVVSRGTDLVGAAFVFDGLAVGRGWMMDIYARPGDPRAHAIQGALIDAALREGRYRWDAMHMDPDLPLPVAKSGCYSNDVSLLADLGKRGFSEVRRYWRMKVDHGSVEGPSSAAATAPSAAPGRSGDMPQGYAVRAFRDVESDWLGLHQVSSASFLDHFDFTPLEYDAWREHQQGETDDPAQWVLAEFDGQVVGFAQGSNRYASEDSGYVARLGVIREHRGRGVARALLRARMGDDVARGFISTILHVDATNPTGATKLYESVGMVADSEFVGLHRPLFS